jgi:hypothetical protein
MVASFLLGRSTSYQQPPQSTNRNISALPKDSLISIALPIILAEQDVYSDNFTKFTTALLDEYDFEAAREFANLLLKDAEADILLKPHAAEIHKQACLYIYEVQSRLQGKGRDMSEFCVQSKITE